MDLLISKMLKLFLLLIIACVVEASTKQFAVTNANYTSELRLEPKDKIAFIIQNNDNELYKIRIYSDNNKLLLINTYDTNGNYKRYKALFVNVKETITYLSVTNCDNITNDIGVHISLITERNNISTLDSFYKFVDEYNVNVIFQYYVFVCIVIFVIFDGQKSWWKRGVMISFIVIEIVINPHMDVIRKFIYLIVKI